MWLQVLTVAMVLRVIIAAASLAFDVNIRRQYRATIATRRYAPHVSSVDDLNDDVGPWHVADEYRGHRIVRHSQHYHIIEIVSGDVVEQEPIADIDQAFKHIDMLMKGTERILTLMHPPHHLS